jgi:hypothetical protein
LYYDGSFIVRNDGPLEGVYIVRVAVDNLGAISWVNVTPSGFVLAPGELRQINFSIEISEDQAAFGTYRFVFMPSLLPQNVEPYFDTFANYVSEVGRYNFTVEITGFEEMPFMTNESLGTESLGTEFPGTESPGTPVSFDGDESRVNLVQYVSPESESRVVTQIDRAIRIDVPSEAGTGQPVNVTISVFEDLSRQGIDLMAISPDGIFYPIEGESFTFDREGRWGVIALIGDLVLLGKPVDVSPGGVRLTMPGLGTILAGIALLMLLSLVPIWLMSRVARKGDPYDEIAYKAYVIKKYVEKFDPQRLHHAVSQLRGEYDDLVDRNIRGDQDKAGAALEELETLALFEPSSGLMKL